jgi:hypothetical protein
VRNAYLILAHSRPRQLATLVGALPRDARVLIHYDKRSPSYDDAFEAVMAVNGSALFVPRHKCWWGAPGIMWATLEMIRTLVNSGLSFDYATLLSGQDYPIKTADRIAGDLSRGGEFIECFSMLEPNRWSGQGPYFGAPDKVLGRFVRFRSHVRRIGTRTAHGVIPYGGSQWWTLSDEALRYVARADERLLRFLARSFIPDESFMQTILGNSLMHERIVQDDLRLAVWDRAHPPYPALLTAADLPAMASSRKHFARKFDFDQHPSLVDQLDKLRAAASSTAM